MGDLYRYLRIKSAAAFDEEDDDNRLEELQEKYDAYDPMDAMPDAALNDDRFFGYMRKAKYSDDPKAMTYDIGTDGFVPVDLGNAFLSGAWNRSKYTVNPARNLAHGDSATKPTGNIYRELRDRGYGGHELKGLSTNTLGLTADKNSDIADTIDYYKGRPSLNVWVDDAGNLVDRSKGVVRGRHIGRLVGAIGGGYGGYKGGDWVAKKLGLNGANAGRLKRLGGTALRTTGLLGGAYYGGKLGNLAGEAVGGFIDPQQGIKLKAYSDNAPLKMLENITNN